MEPLSCSDTHICQWSLSLPEWVDPWVKEQEKKNSFVNVEERMRFVIALSQENVYRQTGGPFGAAIFEQNSGKLLSVGVNRVVLENCAIAHAEIMAFIAAQKQLQCFDLGQKGLPLYQLVTSSQMCSMCCGALIWSGVRSVAYGATAQDVEKIVGFDEGPLHPNWVQEIEKRGIQLYSEILREDACKVLLLYKESDGVVYNGGGFKNA